MIETEGLTLCYGRSVALRDLDLRIPRGHIHAIVGANGAGKSSLFRVLLGFQSPTSGRARILGHDSGQLSSAVRARIGFVNEEHSLPGWLRVDELVAMQRRLYPDWRDDRLYHLIGHFHVRSEQRIRTLSRGERAGVNLAIAMAQAPELLILDEPTLGLDVVAKRAFLQAVLEAAPASDMTIIYCSHQMDEIERLADNLVILERGELRHMSPPDEFCDRVGLWVMTLDPAKLATLTMHPGVLHVRSIDGQVQCLVFDGGEAFRSVLQALGASRIQRGSVNLDQAVNAFLARTHAAPGGASAHA